MPYDSAGGMSGGGMYPFMEGRPVPPPVSPYPLTHQGRPGPSQVDMRNISHGPPTAPSISTFKAPHSRPVKSPSAGEEDDDDDGRPDEDKKKSKKRRRVVVACDTCRRKKVKCEGLPNPANTCNNCENMGYSCSFTVEPDRSRGRYEIVESQRDTLLMALRSVAPGLASQFERGELHTSSPSGTVGSNQQASSLRAAAQSVTKSSPPPNTVTHLPMAKVESNPMVPDLEDGRPRYYGGSSSLLSFNELASRPSSPAPAGSRQSISTVQSGDPVAEENRSEAQGQKSNLAVLPSPMPQFPRNSIAWVRELRRKTLVAVGRDEVFASEGWFNKFPLPDQDLLDELLDYYFHRLHPLLPILHEHSLRRDLGSGRAERDSAFRGLIFTILTIASRFFRGDPRVLAEPNDPGSAGDHWAAASRFHHQVYAASLINVQVLLLSSAFMPSSLGIGTSWTVFGVAIRALQDIGLHTEKAYVGYSSFEQERRRRTFWAAFCLDSIISINMGRPLAIRHADCSVQYPLLALEESLTEAERSGGPVQGLRPDDQTPCVAGGLIYLIKICSLVRDVIGTIYQPVALPTIPGLQKSSPSYKDMTILSKRLDELVTEIPPYLSDIVNSPYPVQAAFLQAGRHNVRLYILKPFIYDFRSPFSTSSAATNEVGRPSVEEGSILRKMLLPQCTSHARGTLAALKALHEGAGVPIIYFLLHQSFLSASTFILTVWHGTKDLELLRSDSSIIEFTLKMYNAESKYASVLLQRAHRILRSVALRCLSVVTDEAQRKRLQEILRQSGASGAFAPATLHSIAKSSVQHPQHIHRQFSEASGGSTRRAVHHAQDMHSPQQHDGRARTSHARAAGQPMSPHSILSQGSPTSKRLHGRNGHDWPPSPHTRALHNSGHLFGSAVDDGRSSKHGSPRIDGVGYDPALDALDLQQWLLLAEGTPKDQFDGAATPSGFHFAGDHSWTDYFSRFLGGLPDPGVHETGQGPGTGLTPEARSSSMQLSGSVP